MSTSKTPGFELDHIGVAVKSLKEAAPFWTAMGWDTNIPIETVKEQKVEVQMLGLGNQCNVELLEPTEASSPIAQFLGKRGPGIHHICFRVKDIESVLQKLKAQNVRLINEAPVHGAHNCLVAFIHPASTGGILIELSERKTVK